MVKKTNMTLDAVIDSLQYECNNIDSSDINYDDKIAWYDSLIAILQELKAKRKELEYYKGIYKRNERHNKIFY